jgi:hypothetical protein
MRKHQYSASVCAKSAYPLVPKLTYIVQHFTLFPMMYTKFGHKLTNLKTARINKVIIAFVYRITLRKIYIQEAFAQDLSSQLFPSSTVVCSVSETLHTTVELGNNWDCFMLFQMMRSKLGHKLTNVKTARINKVIIALICL